MKKILVLVLAVCMLMCLSACQKNEQNLKESLVGTWECEGVYLTLYPDGTGKQTAGGSTFDITYQVNGDSLTLTYRSSPVTLKSVTINSNPKTFTATSDGSQMTWTYVGEAVRS